MEELRGVEGMESLPSVPRFIRHDLSISELTEEGKLFRILCDQMENALENRSMSALIKLELWMRIQQFLVHPQIYIDSMRASMARKGGVYTRPDWSEDAGATKWNACMTELRRAVDEKIGGTIVFCQFRAEMDRVCLAAETMGASVFAIRGGMTSDAVGEAVAAASAAVAEGRDVVVVVQIVAGGAGLNLQFCGRILFLSQHWNPAVVHQAVGRAVRIGQRGCVEIHTFAVVDDVCDNLDRRMAELHLAKIAGARLISPSLYDGFSSFVAATD
jgi:SNF2 family DNA or RNA helicase